MTRKKPTEQPILIDKQEYGGIGLPPCEVSTVTNAELDQLARDALPQPPPEDEELPELPRDVTTIKMPLDLKNELDVLKVDDQEPYAGVIRRLIDGRLPIESTEETVILSRKTYNWLMLIIDDRQVKEMLRKGVR